jgi:hypothetical protein
MTTKPTMMVLTIGATIGTTTLAMMIETMTTAEATMMIGAGMTETTMATTTATTMMMTDREARRVAYILAVGRP